MHPKNQKFTLKYVTKTTMSENKEVDLNKDEVIIVYVLVLLYTSMSSEGQTNGGKL